MSSTRTAKPGTPPRQERYMSSYERGLLGNLVAKRCERLSPTDRAPIIFLQWLSWQPGGLAEAQRAIGSDELERLCVDPSFLPRELWQAVADYRAAWIASRAPVVETTIGRRIADAIAFAQSAPVMVLIEGVARIGKSFAALDVCQRSAGLVRYVQAPSGNDDTAFFRAFAKSLGVACALSMKSQQMRDRVEEALQGAGVAVVIDEAHYCFDAALHPRMVPMRINWILTALVNKGVPVIMVATHQFEKSLARVEKSTGWSSQQLTGRISYREQLPDKLPMPDLLAVARAVYPEGDAKSWRALAAYADLSETHLAAITALATRARWHATQAGRSGATAEDLRRAIMESRTPVKFEAVTPARSPRAAASRPFRVNNAGLVTASDEMISAWRSGPVPLPAD